MTHPTPSATGEMPLWSDERVYREMGAVADAMIDYPSSFNVGLAAAFKVGFAIRDDLTAALAAKDARVKELTQQLETAYKRLSEMEIAWAETAGELAEYHWKEAETNE